MSAGLFAPAAPLDLEQAPETVIAVDLVRRGLPVAPAIIAVAAAIAGWDGAISAAFAIALVLGNFLLSAALTAGAARISLGMVMGAVLFGYLLRLGIISGAVLLVKDLDWAHLPVLGITLIVTHLGLLFWETRYVSASLAFPTLKPDARRVPASEPVPSDSTPSGSTPSDSTPSDSTPSDIKE